MNVLAVIVSTGTHGNDGEVFSGIGPEKRALSFYLHVRVNIFKLVRLARFGVVSLQQVAKRTSLLLCITKVGRVGGC
jgi:hypothetical protein